MNLFNNNSPVNQDFIWFAEYASGKTLCEFDLETKKENSFYSIVRKDLIRFGLFGHGMNFYIETFGGVFKIAGQMIEIIYKVGDKEFYLTGQPQMYNDIITFKDAESTIDLVNGGAINTQIMQFNFGYKSNFNIEDVSFNFKPICKIPFNQPVNLSLRVVSNKDLNGVLQIKKNGRIVEEFQTDLKAGVGEDFIWVVK